MKLVLAVFSGLIAMSLAIPAFADGIFSSRVFSTETAPKNIPATLYFKADKIHVISPTWYNSIFEEPGCERFLTERNLDTSIEIEAAGANAISLSLNAHPSKMIAEARANYIPVYYQASIPVHPHFMIRLHKWVLLHAVIHKSGDLKTLKLSMVQGKADDIHLVPILEATGR